MLISSCQNCLLIPNRDFSKGLKNEFEAAVADEPSVFDPLKLYCIGNYEVQYLIKFEKLILRFAGLYCNTLTLKAPITTAADDSPNYFFIVFQRK